MLKRIVTLKCPECHNSLNCEYLDMSIDKLVYKCTKCNKEWI